MSALSQKESDIQLMLAASCHLGTRNCDYQMERYVYKRRLDGIYVINLGKTWEKLHLAARVIVGIENPQVSSPQLGLVECVLVESIGHGALGKAAPAFHGHPRPASELCSNVSRLRGWSALSPSAAEACSPLQCWCCPGSGLEQTPCWLQDIVVQSARPYGQRAVLKFAQYTGAKALAGRHTPGELSVQTVVLACILLDLS